MLILKNRLLKINKYKNDLQYILKPILNKKTLLQHSTFPSLFLFNEQYKNTDSQIKSLYLPFFPPRNVPHNFLSSSWNCISLCWIKAASLTWF